MKMGETEYCWWRQKDFIIAMAILFIFIFGYSYVVIQSEDYQDSQCSWLNDTGIYGSCLMDSGKNTCVCFKSGQGHIIFKIEQIEVMQKELEQSP